MKIEVGKKYIVRAKEAGVFFGEITEKNGDEVTMKDVRCLWYWSGAASLMELANEGVRFPNDCKFTVKVSELEILGVCEILPCTDRAVACIEAVREWTA